MPEFLNNLPATVEIDIYQGADFGFEIEVVEDTDAETAIPLEGGTATMVFEDVNGDTVLTLDETDGLTLTDGLVQVRIPAADTATMPTNTRKTDLFVTFPDSGDVRALVRGRVRVHDNVTETHS